MPRLPYRMVPPPFFEEFTLYFKQLPARKIIQKEQQPLCESSSAGQKKRQEASVMWVDFKLRNSHIIKATCPLPRGEESMNALTGAQGFRTLDVVGILPGARPTNDISIEFEIRPKFAGL